LPAGFFTFATQILISINPPLHMIRLIQYSENHFSVTQSKEVMDIIRNIKDSQINWIDVEVVEDDIIVEQIANCFGIHQMIVEDILTQDHLPKLEVFDTHLFFTLRMLHQPGNENNIKEEQLSIVLGSNYVITFQSGIDGDAFDKVRESLKFDKSLLRTEKADYLFYHLVDSVVDEYVNILEQLRDEIETLEDEILTNPQPSEVVVGKIITLRKQVSKLRKFTAPLKDIVYKLKVAPPKFILPTTLTYLQDISDHLFRLNSDYETFREMLKDLMELYLSNLSHNMNNVMKTLTIVATIFIPLTFIAGVYGMNFNNMPELKWEYGYFFIWGIMVATAFIMLWYMKKKSWF